MISSLLIKNLLIIHYLEINFQNGFNALTGETGAGKSILIDCLGFALGHSGRRGSNRKDVSKEGEVVVSFQLDSNNPALKVLHDAGFNVGSELIVRRMVNTEGKKRSFINDKPCTAEFLRNLSSHLVEFQGQNEERGLLYERNHISFLDDFGKCQSMGKSVGQTWTKLLKKNSELESLKAESQNMKDRKEFLLAAIAEIEDFNPKVGEENILLDKRKTAKNISRILEHLGNAYNLVSSEKIERAFLSASKELIAFDRLLPKKVESSIENIDKVLDSLGKISNDLKEELGHLSDELENVDSLDERFFDLRSVARKYDTSCEKLVELPGEFKLEVQRIEDSNLDQENLSKEILILNEKYQNLSRSLSSLRRKAAERLDRSMNDQLPYLKLENSSFKTQVREVDAGNSGIDKVYFTASTNKGVDFGPLDKVASGGELSRFLLALKVCLTKDSKGTVLLFDEIDRGVGGATADAIGRRLAGLASFGQVITVTHSPQVAALASNHFQVSKSLNETGAVEINIKKLDQKDRVLELARMISGKVVTNEAKAAAESLILNGEASDILA